MCDCCDPTSPSPDPVVVRLERENKELREQLELNYEIGILEIPILLDEARKLYEARADNATLRGLLRDGHDNFPPSWEWRSKVTAALDGKP